MAEEETTQQPPTDPEGQEPGTADAPDTSAEPGAADPPDTSAEPGTEAHPDVSGPIFKP